jgi:hypothetical protein
MYYYSSYYGAKKKRMAGACSHPAKSASKQGTDYTTTHFTKKPHLIYPLDRLNSTNLNYYYYHILSSWCD